MRGPQNSPGSLEVRLEKKIRVKAAISPTYA